MEKREPSTLMVGIQTGTATMENSVDLAHAFPTLDSANSVNSKTTGITNKARDTTGLVGRIPCR